MYLLIGLVIVAASVATGYTMAHGEWGVLFQPAEFIIILGCGVGAFFGSQTKYTFGLVVKSLKHLFADPGSSKNHYLETLALLYALFSKMHREGVISIESDVEKPESSPIFSKYPNISKDTVLVNFVGDTLRVYLTTGDPADIDSLMDVDIETDGLHICISGHYRVLRTASFHAADRATRIALREQAAVCTYL